MGIVKRNKSIFPAVMWDANEAKEVILNNFDYVDAGSLVHSYNPDAKTITFSFRGPKIYPVLFAVNRVKSGYLVHSIFENGQIHTAELTKR